MSVREGQVMVGSNMSGKKRSGTCGWCGRHKVRGLRYTVWVEGGAYHAASVCEICLREYREGLMTSIRKGEGGEWLTK